LSGRILLLTHQDTACPGRVGEELRARGFATVACRPVAGDPLPDPNGFAGVVVFGGKMSANDEHLDFIRDELRWIPRVLAADVPYLGICLGGQLLARSLGARVAPHDAGLHEIGYAPIRPTAAGRELFPSPLHVYQWHREGFDVPRGADLLASGDVFAHQAFRCGIAVGLQFHPEATPDIVTRWTEDGEDLDQPGAQSREDQFAAAPVHDPVVARWLGRFLDRWLGGQPQTAAA